MDGNQRWAQQHKVTHAKGHRQGMEALQTLVEYAGKTSVRFLTVYAFSSENWKRPTHDVAGLMRLFEEALDRAYTDLNNKNVRIRFIGETQQFSKTLQKKIASAVNITAENTGVTLVLAMNYGGHWDIINACKNIALQVNNNTLHIDAVTDVAVAKEMAIADLPPVDMCVRTGGEQRLSNFLLWQLAYAELYFTQILWPDFSTGHLDAVITEFKERQRRFGG